MEVYNVTVWDTNRNYEDSEGWAMESPPVRVRALDSYEAALKVARRADPKVVLEGIPRPMGWTGMLFKDQMGFVFQVEDLNIERPYWWK